MTSYRGRLDQGLAREIAVVVALTLAGGVLRMWSPGRLGMLHFDEGIYALAGLWVFSPHGLGDFDPASQAYAPPGFPVLVGLSYLALGVGDLPAILVSIVAGTLTIPMVAWLARRTFGSGAGAAAAAFAALSGPHIAFSRMALTDASFLLFWVLAIGQGQRFLERPNPARAVWLGLTVGLAQLFKYNGWISGGIIALSAALSPLGRPRERRASPVIATWGWGSAAALVAAAVYWPWFQFVESHGGYSALLAHERSYLGGFSSWPGHLFVQLAQAGVLAGGPVWLGYAGLAAAIALIFSAGDFSIERRFLTRVLVEALALAVFCLWLLPNLVHLYILFRVWLTLTNRARDDTKPIYVLGVAWAALIALSPFYHPYARLWLPLEACKWLFLGNLFASIRAECEVAGRSAGGAWKRPGDRLPWFAVLCVVGAAIHALGASWSWRSRSPGLLDPSDSVRRACHSIASELPKGVSNLQVLARPSVTFYLGLYGLTGVQRQPDVRRLLQAHDRGSWALLDMAMVRQAHLGSELPDPLFNDWSIVRDFPTRLSLPVLLDIDPPAGGEESFDAVTDLQLLRRRRPGELSGDRRAE
jgi:4-amino-4-deoxy-L-arabinose transferase-like glycosyltransferase